MQPPKFHTVGSQKYTRFEDQEACGTRTPKEESIPSPPPTWACLHLVLYLLVCLAAMTLAYMVASPIPTIRRVKNCTEIEEIKHDLPGGVIFCLLFSSLTGAATMMVVLPSVSCSVSVPM